MLKRAMASGYTFVCFDEVLDKADSGLESLESPPELSRSKQDKGRILLRHDVDVDLSAAAVMACAEARLGIKSTYFLMWRSPCYNLMSRAGQQYAEQILELGHDIGLHYDQGFDSSRSKSGQFSADQINLQADWIEHLLACQVTAVSFHQPSKALLQADVQCGKRVNTYDRSTFGGFRYISDSNRIFPLWVLTDESPGADHELNALKRCFPEDLQLLVHPMWWVYDEDSTHKVWDMALTNNFKQAQKQFLETERAYGLEREIIIKKINSQ
jgi:hypothetical protein